MRWLWVSRGPQLLARAYAGERLDAVYGPLEPLAAEHGKFLDARAVSPRARALLEQRFRAPGIARKRCPHEVAGLSREAQLALTGRDPQRAVALLQKCVALEPDDPNLIVALRRAQ